MFKNNHNSCYIDSFLMAIMHIPNPIIQGIINAESAFSGKGNLTMEKNIISIREEFKKIYAKIQDGGIVFVCSTLRNQFAKFEEAYAIKYKKEHKKDPLINIEWQYQQNEPYDVAILLERALKMPTYLNKREIYKGEPNEIKQVSYSDIIIQTFDQDKVRIKDFFPTYKDTFYNQVEKAQVTKITEYSNAQAALITIKREYTEPQFGEQHKGFAKVECEETITMPDNNQLNLVSIIVHHGSEIHAGHYTCLIKQKNTWFEFDDREPSFTHIGEFVQIPNKVFKNVVGLVYI